MPAGWQLFQVGLTVGAGFHGMDNFMAGMRDGFACMFLVSGLYAAFFAIPLEQTLRRMFAQPVTGGWFSTVADVLRHLVFQGLHAGSQLAKHLMNEGNYRLLPLVGGNTDFVITG